MTTIFNLLLLALLEDFTTATNHVWTVPFSPVLAKHAHLDYINQVPFLSRVGLAALGDTTMALGKKNVTIVYLVHLPMLLD
jgi:hypothetical protein